MGSYSIGLTGLTAASGAMTVVGNNVANAGTEGYHRQVAGLSANKDGGVELARVARLVDRLLETELVEQDSTYGQLSQELSTLSMVETMFGEFATESGLNSTIDQFFTSLESLSANPLDDVYRNAVITAAETMANEFQSLGASLVDLKDKIIQEAENKVESINLLTSQIADLNGRIQALSISGGAANNLADNRDHLVSQLSQLTSIQTQERDNGIVDISVGGVAVVSGTAAIEIAIEMQADESLDVSVSGTSSVSIGGGELGGLMALKNELIPGIESQLDTLAQGIINSVNGYHVQGLGEEGSFTELSGWAIGDDLLTAADSPVTDGSFFIRVTNTATGEVRRYEIEVNVSGATPDTPDTIAAKIDAIPGLTASMVSSELTIVSDLQYTFDFLPAVDSEPATTFASASAPTVEVSGIYEGQENDTLTFTVTGSGDVGNGDVRLVVTNGDGDTLDTLNVGDGYAAGDVLSLSNGISVSLTTGTLTAGDKFTVDAYATTDTSGFLAAAGMNVFFSGTDASNMAVSDEILRAPNRIATAYGPELTDNTAALRLAGVYNEDLDSLEDQTISEYYQQLVAGVGQEVSLRESRVENIESVILDLETQRSELSGVDVNEEAANLMIYEKLFQAMAEYLNTLQNCMMSLMDVL
ncbi:MAG: flagellar hook-associated protein FlgK [Solirubrobacterales bacterium]